VSEKEKKKQARRSLLLVNVKEGKDPPSDKKEGG